MTIYKTHECQHTCECACTQKHIITINEYISKYIHSHTVHLDNLPFNSNERMNVKTEIVRNNVRLSFRKSTEGSIHDRAKPPAVHLHLHALHAWNDRPTSKDISEKPSDFSDTSVQNACRVRLTVSFFCLSSKIIGKKDTNAKKLVMLHGGKFQNENTDMQQGS